MTAAAQKALAITLKHEGGYVNDPKDKGGETYCGISRKNFPNWKGWAFIDKYKPIVVLADDVNQFYIDNFWNKIKGDSIASPAVAAFLFDFYVNAGGNAIKTLQTMLKAHYGFDVAEDGVFGNNTLNALNSAINKWGGERSANSVLEELYNRRARYYDKINQPRFIKGWLARNEAVFNECLKMI